jgi:integrase/recombinase XerD
MDAVLRVGVTGPLTRHVEGFASELRSNGYTELSLANQLRLLADLSRWLESAGLGLRDVDRLVVDRFLAKRRRTHTQFLTERALQPLLDYLITLGAVRKAAPAKPRRSGLLVSYERFLVEDRAVGKGHLAVCLTVADEFLDHGARDVKSLTAADVTRFVGSDKPNLTGRLTGLRSILRFLFITKRIATNLVYAVPRSPQWKLRSLPQPLEPQQLAAVLSTCDRRSLVGRRDYAVLQLMARLGLRAGEVSALSLDDMDWKLGEIVVHGKGRVRSRLPLPVDVGQAVVDYLQRAERNLEARSVFVRCRAPYRALASGGVIAIAQTALRAAGVTGGAHRLRHTAATQMLRAGASLTEIAQVLRHRYINTTAIYAKVDHDRLRELARAWPSDVGRIDELARAWPGGAA